MEDNCFTILCLFLPYVNMNIYSLPLEPPSHLLPHPTLLGDTEHQIWALCILQQASIGYLILHMVMYMFQCYSLNSSHPVHSSFSMSASPLLPYRRVHQYHLSRFHTYHQYMIFVFLFLLVDFTLYNRLLGSSASLELSDFTLYNTLKFIHLISSF